MVSNQKLQEKDRHHIPGPDPYVEILGEPQFVLFGQAKRKYALAPSPPPAVKAPVENGQEEKKGKNVRNVGKAE